jgi:hypothetical protein
MRMMRTLVRIFVVGVTLLVTIPWTQSSFAQCGFMSCDGNCGRFCKSVRVPDERKPWRKKTVTLCAPEYKGCRDYESACRSENNRVLHACRTAPTFSGTVSVLRTAARQRQITAAQCADARRIGTVLYSTPPLGPLGGYIADACACLACSEAFK